MVKDIRDKLESLRGKELFVTSYTNGEVCITVPLSGSCKQEIVRVGEADFLVKFIPKLSDGSPFALWRLKHKISAVVEIDPDLLK